MGMTIKIEGGHPRSAVEALRQANFEVIELPTACPNSSGGLASALIRWDNRNVGTVHVQHHESFPNAKIEIYTGWVKEEPIKALIDVYAQAGYL